MRDVTENDLRGAIKALTDVVTPAVDPADPLALEQLRLVVEYLEFLRTRFEFIPDRERYELGQSLGLARQLVDCVPPAEDLAGALAEAVAASEAAHATNGAAAAELRHWSAVLSAIIREIVRAAQKWPPESRRRIETTVIELSGQRIEFERAWFLPMKLDPAPAEIAPLKTFFEGLTSGAEAGSA